MGIRTFEYLRDAVFVNLLYSDFHRLTCQSKIHYLLKITPFHILHV